MVPEQHAESATDRQFPRNSPSHSVAVADSGARTAALWPKAHSASARPTLATLGAHRLLVGSGLFRCLCRLFCHGIQGHWSIEPTLQSLAANDRSEEHTSELQSHHDL